jgi:hypothetical protein
MTGCQLLTALGRRESRLSEPNSESCLDSPLPLSNFKPSQIVLGAH